MDNLKFWLDKEPLPRKPTHPSSDITSEELVTFHGDKSLQIGALSTGRYDGVPVLMTSRPNSTTEVATGGLGYYLSPNAERLRDKKPARYLPDGFEVAIGKFIDQGTRNPTTKLSAEKFLAKTGFIKPQAERSTTAPQSIHVENTKNISSQAHSRETSFSSLVKTIDIENDRATRIRTLNERGPQTAEELDAVLKAIQTSDRKTQEIFRSVIENWIAKGQISPQGIDNRYNLLRLRWKFRHESSYPEMSSTLRKISKLFQSSEDSIRPQPEGIRIRATRCFLNASENLP